MNPENAVNAGGWEASSMRTYEMNRIYESLPEELSNIIINTIVVSGHGSTSGENNFTTTDKLYLLSGKEILGEDSDDTASDVTRQLDYYSNLDSSAIKKLDGNATDWWLRSANRRCTMGFRLVTTSGSLSFDCSYNFRGVSPAFRIG